MGNLLRICVENQLPTQDFVSLLLRKKEATLWILTFQINIGSCDPIFLQIVFRDSVVFFAEGKIRVIKKLKSLTQQDLT